MKPLPLIIAGVVAAIALGAAALFVQTQQAAAAGDPGALERLRAWVMDHNGTERPFENAYWNNHEPGIYVEARTGEPLFASTDKFDSGSGWPSFTRPIAIEAVAERDDASAGMQRTEVRSARGNAHLGHVFNDGPRDKGGQRYCVNSCALRFIPRDRMEAEGYGQYIDLIDHPPPQSQ
jgi:methionine-R-sulfoxide reductase